MVVYFVANCFYKGKEVRSRSDRDRELQLSWAHTVTLIHTDINFRVTDSVARNSAEFSQADIIDNSRTVQPREINLTSLDSLGSCESIYVYLKPKKSVET